MMKYFWLVVCAALMSGCASTSSLNETALRVGVSPNYPPMIFSQDGDLKGLEVDMMRMLGRKLGRPVTAVELPWNEMIDALIAGKIDVIMSGMSITQARKVKIEFTDAWMQSGLMAMMRRAQADQFPSVDTVLQFSGNIGVLANTTAEDFVRRSCPNARVIKIASASDASIQLKHKTIDLFVHDIPSIAWQVSSNEAELAALLEPLNREQIGWGVRRDDTELLGQLNTAIATWQADGSLEKAIQKWIPYYDRIK